jgi:outer membrane receptor for ferrienterochelin and colicin
MMGRPWLLSITKLCCQYLQGKANPMPVLTRTTSSILLCCVGLQAAASTTAEPAKVEVKAKAEDHDPRRDDTAGKTVIRQDEIMKYGDTSVYDVLKRAPGVTVVDNTIRMRGLAGYTQVLVNGQRPPPGFSMDALAPDQIERIEIIRAASA